MQTRVALKRLSNGKTDHNDTVTTGGPLEQNASWLFKRQAAREGEIQAARERHDLAQAMPILEAARKMIARAVGDRVLPDDAPIATRFDVFNVIKQASKDDAKDQGLKMFATHLQRLWHQDPTGSLTAGAISQLRDHYQSQHPRSRVGEVTDAQVPKIAFSNLPVAQLTRIAADINSQEDYDATILRHGLHGDSPRSIRARALIRELVGRKASLDAKDDGAALGKAKRLARGDVAEKVINRIIHKATEGDAALTPTVEGQPEDQVSVPDDGGKALKQGQIEPSEGNQGQPDLTRFVDPDADPDPYGKPCQGCGAIRGPTMPCCDYGLANPPKTEQTAPQSADKADKPAEVSADNTADAKPDDNKDEKKDGGNPFAEDKKASIEADLLAGKSVGHGDFQLHIATVNGSEHVKLITKRGNRIYELADLDGAIADFMYLTKNVKNSTPPAPTFVIREGFRMTCCGCYGVSSYPMPKEASEIACETCNAIFPAKVVEAAFTNGVAEDEVTIIAFTPIALQEEFGDKFAKLEEMIGVDGCGAVGARVEAYAKHPGAEKMAEVWDYLVEAGFKPLAQFYGDESGMTAADEMPMDAAPPMDMPPGGDMPMDMPGDSPVGDLGEPTQTIEWADNQMVQAAMMHYKAQGNTVIEAITQFSKDYGEDYDPNMVMQTASQVFAISMDSLGAVAKKAAGDIPSTSVNSQQPDAVSVGSQPIGPGSESDTGGEIPTEKPSKGAPSQSGASNSDTNMTNGSDTGNTIPSPGKPQAQPSGGQKGVKHPPAAGPGAGIGKGELSDGVKNPTTSKWDSESSGAYNNQRSK